MINKRKTAKRFGKFITCAIGRQVVSSSVGVIYDREKDKIDYVRVVDFVDWILRDASQG